MNLPMVIGLAVAALVIGGIIGYLIRNYTTNQKLGNANELAERIIRDANFEATTTKQNAENEIKANLLEAKDEIHRLRQDQERENKERRSEVQRMEARLQKREESLDRKSEGLDLKEEKLAQRNKKLESKEKELSDLIERQASELERVAELTRDEAKDALLADVRKDVVHDTALIIRENEQKIREESEKRARDIVVSVIQRYAANHVAETAVSVVPLPNEEMKGRIIGREGRNIRALETLTGIDLIIDDTPEAVVLSGFDPVRREIARMALEKLITDGRIHPTRIEEMVEKATKEMDQIIKDAGEEACIEANVHGLSQEVIRLLGRLKFRTSYGQNVLRHSIEVSTLSAMLAQELGANVRIARRAGLLHDIGKSIDHEVEGTHVEVGVGVLKRNKENREVIHAVEAHHFDVEPQTIEAVIVQAADAISAARPGARRESLDSYIKRLQNLELIANSFDGVEKCFAIQAGRELRIMVQPEKISEDEMTILSRDIAKRIENELEYPGQIKVNIIRETRTSAIAK